ncbi:hypothetical protein [Rhizobium sp. 007]|uniref:hypothetical protein n=1 Tax=Rhizobium sp. 007 TaxID=2785056 RepID=UPI0032B19B72
MQKQFAPRVFKLGYIELETPDILRAKDECCGRLEEERLRDMADAIFDALAKGRSDDNRSP